MYKTVKKVCKNEQSFGVKRATAQGGARVDVGREDKSLGKVL